MESVKKRFVTPFWSMGFRPFFLMVLALAILPTIFWLVHFAGIYSLNVSPLSLSQWHANEMIFGFLFAAVVGFLLTASANWTGTRGIHGAWLFSLFLIFSLTRVLFWATPFQGEAIYRLFGCVLPVLLLLYLARLFIDTNNKRNLILLGPLAVLATGQYLLLSSQYQWGVELSLFSVRFLVVVIAGRVIPFFTKRALGLEPRWNFPFLEKTNMAILFLLIFEPIFHESSSFGEEVWLILTGLAFILNTYRLLNWRFISAIRVPILFILYVAYLWLPVHFLLNLMSHFHLVSDLGKTGLHALTFGCMGTMIFGIIHRVTLGHTGRAIQASGVAVVGYVLIVLGGVARVFGPMLSSSLYLFWVKASGLLWVMAFVALSFVLIPMLISPRVDGKEY